MPRLNYYFSNAQRVDESALSAPLLQPLPVQQSLIQPLGGDTQVAEPLRKYYFNVGKLK